MKKNIKNKKKEQSVWKQVYYTLWEGSVINTAHYSHFRKQRVEIYRHLNVEYTTITTHHENFS